jgi:hypothetical protein
MFESLDCLGLDENIATKSHHAQVTEGKMK